MAWPEVTYPSPTWSGTMWSFDLHHGLNLETGDGDSFALPTTQVGAGIEMFLKGTLESWYSTG